MPCALSAIPAPMGGPILIPPRPSVLGFSSSSAPAAWTARAALAALASPCCSRTPNGPSQPERAPTFPGGARSRHSNTSDGGERCLGRRDPNPPPLTVTAHAHQLTTSPTLPRFASSPAGPAAGPKTPCFFACPGRPPWQLTPPWFRERAGMSSIRQEPSWTQALGTKTAPARESHGYSRTRPGLTLAPHCPHCCAAEAGERREGEMKAPRRNTRRKCGN